MNLFLAVLGLVSGLALLLLGAEVLVRNARMIGLGFGLRPMIVGATIVAFGTSAPEFLVSLVAAFEGQPGLAMGNLMGSNIANIALVLGATALVRPVPSTPGLLKNEYLTCLLATLAIPLFVFIDTFQHPEGAGYESIRYIDQLEGMLLCLGFALFFWTYLRHAQKLARLDRREDDPPRERIATSTWVLAVAGLGMLMGGSTLVVETASHLAEVMGVEASVVGATVLAIGTSLPELATTVVAAMRGEDDIAIGNVLGSNVFNLLFVLGPVSTIRPMAVSPTDQEVLLPLMVAVTLVLGVMLRFGPRITRVEGIALLGVFAGYLILLVQTQG